MTSHASARGPRPPHSPHRTGPPLPPQNWTPGVVEGAPPQGQLQGNRHLLLLSSNIRLKHSDLLLQCLQIGGLRLTRSISRIKLLLKGFQILQKVGTFGTVWGRGR